jgi:hypothetical protein
MSEERGDGVVKDRFHLLWPHGLLPSDTGQTGERHRSDRWPLGSSQWSFIGSTDLRSVKPRIWIIPTEGPYR